LRTSLLWACIGSINRFRDFAITGNRTVIFRKEGKIEFPESRDLASEWLPFSSYIALTWLQFGFIAAFSEDLGLLPDCYQIAVLCHLAAKRFFSFASVLLQLCFSFASFWIPSQQCDFYRLPPDG